MADTKVFVVFYQGVEVKCKCTQRALDFFILLELVFTSLEMHLLLFIKQGK